MSFLFDNDLRNKANFSYDGLEELWPVQYGVHFL